MSIREYPLNGVTYKIGYEGLEHNCEGLPGIIADFFRATYRWVPLTKFLSAKSVALLDSDPALSTSGVGDTGV